MGTQSPRLSDSKEHPQHRSSGISYVSIQLDEVILMSSLDKGFSEEISKIISLNTHLICCFEDTHLLWSLEAQLSPALSNTRYTIGDKNRYTALVK